MPRRWGITPTLTTLAEMAKLIFEIRYIENVNTLYLAKILNYIVYYEIAIYINYILHDVCFPKNMGVMPRATLSIRVGRQRLGKLTLC